MIQKNKYLNTMKWLKFKDVEIDLKHFSASSRIELSLDSLIINSSPMELRIFLSLRSIPSLSLIAMV